MRLRLLAALFLLVGPAGPVTADEAPPALRFVRDGTPPRTLTLPALSAECGVETIALDDPYYGKRKTFLACPLAAVLRLGFGTPIESFAGQTVIFRARDGYAKPAAAARLAEPGGYVAFADAERLAAGQPGWEPIDRKQVDPAPFYLVWTGPGQTDTHRYPWPYALAEIELVALDQRYPHIAPSGTAPDSPARAGYAIFTGECIACHAINGEGGTVGPDLNVPQSIVEYRPTEQIKAYIRNPATLRYTSMPAHPHLSDAQLDDLIAYFDAMRTRKHDPGRTP